MANQTPPTLRAAIEALAANTSPADIRQFPAVAELVAGMHAALAQPDAGEGEANQALRERFEKWATGWGLSVARSNDGATVGYDYQETGMAWLAVLAFATPADTPSPSPQPSMTREESETAIGYCPKCRHAEWQGCYTICTTCKRQLQREPISVVEQRIGKKRPDWWTPEKAIGSPEWRRAHAEPETGR